MTCAAGLRSVLAVLAAVLIAGCASDSLLASPAAATTPSLAPSPVATKLPTPTPSAMASPAPVVTASPSPAPPTFPAKALAIPPTAKGWRPVPDQKAVRQVQLMDVVWTGSRFVAASWDGFLDSTDGISWHRQKNPGRWGPTALAAGPDGVVAVGRIGDRLASWHSMDGLTWATAQRALPAHSRDDTTINDVVATPSGWLAVGGEAAGPCASECGWARAYAWRSTDGLHWTRAPDQASLKKAELTSVTRAGDRFVAGGEKGSYAALWTSPDGVTWTRSSGASFGRASAGGLLPRIFAVAARSDTVVAVGADDAQDVGGRAHAWWSSDGKAWTAAKVQRPRDAVMQGVTATRQAFLAVGGSAAYSCRGGIWESPDGRAWRCIARERAFKGFVAFAAAASDTVEIAVGITQAGYDENSAEAPPGAVWWRPTP